MYKPQIALPVLDAGQRACSLALTQATVQPVACAAAGELSA